MAALGADRRLGPRGRIVGQLLAEIHEAQTGARARARARASEQG